MFENLPLSMNVAVMAGAAVAVWLAGGRLVRRADELGRKTGIGGAVIGMLLLGAMTSLPEIAVAVTATLNDAPLLPVNDVLGAAAVNMLILALADAVYGRRAPLTSTPGDPQVLLQGTLSLLLLVLVPGATLVGDTLVLGVGVWSWVLLGTYGLSAWIVSWVPDPKAPRHHEPAQGKEPVDSKSRLMAYICATGSVILAAGFLLAQSAQAIAEQTGLGTSFVGAVLLAMCTSLPEVSTVTAAVRMGRHQMAIGEVFGSNLFNANIIVLVDALHPGDPVLVAAGPFAAFAASLAAVMTLMFLVGIIERRDRTVWRLGVDSMAAVGVYIAGVIVLYHLR